MQQIELLRDISRGSVRVALLDFDGTLSLIRQGWQEVMVGFMVETLIGLDSNESAEDLQTEVVEFVGQLTGKQTIYQMIRLAEEVERRGGTPQDPLHYKRCYHDRLLTKIRARIDALRSGTASPEEWTVRGSHELLRNLKKRGVGLYLASGTDTDYVLEEARLLGLSSFFGDHIYGAIDDYKSFSKQKLIRQIILDEGLAGPNFVAFGDGYVEIENAKEVGGTAVGVASNEESRQGVDPWKRSRLIDSGADIIIGDFRCQERLIGYLFGELEL